MNGTQTTTYPKAKLAEIKKRGGRHIANDLLIDMGLRDDWVFLSSAKAAAKLKLDSMTARQVTQFLKDNGYVFDSARACWKAAAI